MPSLLSCLIFLFLSFLFKPFPDSSDFPYLLISCARISFPSCHLHPLLFCFCLQYKCDTVFLKIKQDQGASEPLILLLILLSLSGSSLLSSSSIFEVSVLCIPVQIHVLSGIGILLQKVSGFHSLATCLVC